MESLRERVLNDLEDRRYRVLNGGINSIPSPFKRFSNDFIGIEQGTYTTVTSFTKGGKSQFTSYLFIYQTLLYAYYSKQDIKVTVFYFPLEETPERIMHRFMSYLLNDMSDGKIRISPRDLRSSRNDAPLPEDILEVLKSDTYVDILDFFEKNIIFSNETNPTGIYKFCKNYAEEHGTTYYKDITIKDELGNPQVIKSFERYEPDDPNEYKLVIIDTINLIDTEKGLSLKQAMDKLSEYLAKYLRNRYNFSPVVIQQQSFESEGNEAFKLGKVRPSVAGLGDSKYTSRDRGFIYMYTQKYI